MVLTLSDMGARNLCIHGPRGLADILKAARYYLRRFATPRCVAHNPHHLRSTRRARRRFVHVEVNELGAGRQVIVPLADSAAAAPSPAAEKLVADDLVSIEGFEVVPTDAQRFVAVDLTPSEWDGVAGGEHVHRPSKPVRLNGQFGVAAGRAEQLLIRHQHSHTRAHTQGARIV
jgi:hypothetical protein